MTFPFSILWQPHIVALPLPVASNHITKKSVEQSVCEIEGASFTPHFGGANQLKYNSLVTTKQNQKFYLL